MRCEKLMIGDWVMHTDPINNGEKAQVKEIHGDGYITVDGAITKMFAPIPLTAEILEKNGFVLIEKEKGAYGVNIAPYYTRDDVPFEVFCDGEPFAIWFKDPVNIKFVHQLQHALRLCGIDKEIEL